MSCNDSVLLDHIYEDAQTSYALLDSEFNFIRVNKAYAAGDAKSPSYFVGKNHFDLFPNKENQAIFEKCVELGEPYYAKAKAFDYEYNPERGTSFWDWSLQPIKNSQGVVVTLLLALIDVSERIHVEQLLNKAQEIANIGTWNWDIKNNKLEWTDEIYRIFEKRPEEFGATYDNFLDLIHPDDREMVNGTVQESLNNPEQLYTVEHRIELDGGRIKFVEEHGKVYCDVDDVPSRMIGTIIDVTTRKQQELAEERHRIELEQEVARKTAELLAAQEEILKNEKMATLGKLTATIGHEIRNPLAVMKPNIFLLRSLEETPNETREKCLSAIERNVDRCDQIIDELLTFSRSTKLYKQRVEFHSWLKGLLNDTALPEGLKIELDLEDSSAILHSDLNRLSRAVSNIIDNAISSMYENDQTRKLRASSILRISTRVKNRNLFLTITDNGCGIAPEVLPNIMEPLFSTKNFGVGLGMGIIEQITHEHGGHLDIQSTLDQGTSVSISLPLAEETTPES